MANRHISLDHAIYSLVQVWISPLWIGVVQFREIVRSIRVKTVLDDSGEVRIPVPAGLHPGESVELEVFFHDRSRKSTKSWAEMLDSVEGIFEDCPLEIPQDPPPEPVELD